MSGNSHGRSKNASNAFKIIEEPSASVSETDPSLGRDDSGSLFSSLKPVQGDIESSIGKEEEAPQRGDGSAARRRIYG